LLIIYIEDGLEKLVEIVDSHITKKGKKELNSFGIEMACSLRNCIRTAHGVSSPNQIRIENSSIAKKMHRKLLGGVEGQFKVRKGTENSSIPNS
jgi:hypothetical protein